MDSHIKMCDLVTKLATMTASDRKSAGPMIIQGNAQIESAVHIDGRHPIHTVQDLGDEFVEDGLDESEVKQRDPKSVISKRTRSNKSIVTPISVSHMGKKYKYFGAYWICCVPIHVDFKKLCQSLNNTWIFQTFMDY